MTNGFEKSTLIDYESRKALTICNQLNSLMIKALLLGLLIVSLVSCLPYEDQMCLANSLIVGRDDYSDLYAWECKVCESENKPIHTHFIEEKAKDVKCILSVYEDFMVLAFRYTNTAQNVWQDILYPLQIEDEHTCSKCKVQKAYHTMWEVIREDVEDDIKEMKRVTGIETLYITGISLGGGLAVISYIDIAHQVLFNDIKVITWGAPRVGNNKWAAHFDQITHRRTKRYFIKGDPIIVLPRCLTLLCTYEQTGIPITCVEDEATCVQNALPDEPQYEEGKEILRRNRFKVDSQFRTLGGIVDHIEGYPKIYNFTLIAEP